MGFVSDILYKINFRQQRNFMEPEQRGPFRGYNRNMYGQTNHGNNKRKIYGRQGNNQYPFKTQHPYQNQGWKGQGERLQGNKKKHYDPKESYGGFHGTQYRNTQQKKTNAKKVYVPLLPDKISLSKVIPAGDYRRFKMLCTNTLQNASNIDVVYSIRRPLLQCTYTEGFNNFEKYMGDVVHQNRIKNVVVDIELLWRTYTLLYKQVPEEYWGIAKFGMLRAMEKKKDWANRINIYKHRQLLKIYYVIDQKMLHFLLLHKEFRRVEYSSSYIEQNKFKFPHEYRAFEKFRKFLLKEQENDDIEAADELDSEEENPEREGSNIEEIEERIKEIVERNMDWVEDELTAMKMQLQEMDFNQERNEFLNIAIQFQTMSQEFISKQKMVKEMNQKKMSEKQKLLTLKLLVMAEKQLESKLPVCFKKQSIFKTLDSEQLVILVGQTGSGKSTQLPQLLCQYYKLFENQNSKPVLITQPRKIATRTLAQRVADELQENIHGLVDYQTASHKKTNPHSKILFKLDRLVLDQLTEDPLLSKYCCLVVDQAHERTISIDVILGRLKVILNQRKDFKIIITSASMDSEKFQKYFRAKIVNIPGRMYSVKEIYEPMSHVKNTKDKIERFLKDYLFEKDLSKLRDAFYGHVLVFCPGLEELEDLTQKFKILLNQKSFSVLPLHGKLSPKEQQLVFRDEGRVKIIFATKIAETSITIDGIKVVINPGVDRELIYDHKTKISTLHIKMISKSETVQRAGRAGRTGEGFCFHLYPESQRDVMAQNKLPEMQNMPLQTLVLRLKALGQGQVKKFPFIDPPAEKALEGAVTSLKMLGCISMQDQITAIGKLILAIPIEPFLARSIIQSIFYAQFKEFQSLKKTDLIEDVIKILCMLTHSDEIHIAKPKSIQHETELSKKAETDYLETNFEGEFDLFLRIFNDYLEIKKDKEQLNDWAERNNLSLKGLRGIDDYYCQIVSMKESFSKKLEKTSGFLEQVNNREEIAANLKNYQQFIKACLVSSFVSYLSLFSEVPELGYTIVCQKSPVLLSTSTVLAKKENPKWILCYNLFTDQFNRLNTKIAQPIEFSFLKKCLDPEIFAYFRLDKAQKQNPFYHKITHSIPSLMFDKVLADYRNRNFDENLQCLAPFTFVVRQDKNEFSAYCLATESVNSSEMTIERYLNRLKKPLFEPYQYRYDDGSKFMFDHMFKLQSLELKPKKYCLIVDMWFQKQAQKVLELCHDLQIDLQRKSITCVIEDPKILETVKQIIKELDPFQDAMKLQQINLVDTEEEKPEVKLIIKTDYVKAYKKGISLQVFKPPIKIPMGQIWIRNPMMLKEKKKAQEPKQQKQVEQWKTDILEIRNKVIDLNIRGLKFIRVEGQKNLRCYFQNQSAFKQAEQKLNELSLKTSQFVNPEPLQKGKADAIEQLTSIFKNTLRNQNYKQFEIQCPSIKSSQMKVRYNFSLFPTSLKESILKFMKDDPYSLKSIQRKYVFTVSSRSEEIVANFHNTLLSNSLKSIGSIESKTMFHHDILYEVPSFAFQALEFYYYDQANSLNTHQVELIHKKSTTFQGVQVHRIIARHSKSSVYIQKTLEKLKEKIKKIFEPLAVPQLQKYAHILHEIQDGSLRYPSAFIEEIEKEENYEVKMVFEPKAAMLRIYCKEEKKQQIKERVLEKLQNLTNCEIVLSYAEKGLKGIRKVLESNKCEAYSIKYTTKEIIICERPEKIAKITEEIKSLENTQKKQCQICCEQFNTPFRLLLCGHTFCFACLQNWLLSDREVKKCPNMCGKQISLYDIRRIAGEEDFRLMCDFQVSKGVKQSESLFYCYSPDCPQIIEKKNVDSRSRFKCPRCKETYCSICEQKSHTQKLCPKFASDDENLEQLGIKKCPQCKIKVFKDKGCLHIACQCGCHFCWACNEGFKTSSQCYSHLREVHKGIYDDPDMNRDIQMIERRNWVQEVRNQQRQLQRQRIERQRLLQQERERARERQRQLEQERQVQRARLMQIYRTRLQERTQTYRYFWNF